MLKREERGRDERTSKLTPVSTTPVSTKSPSSAGKLGVMARVLDYLRHSSPYLTTSRQLASDAGLSWEEADETLVALERSGAVEGVTVGKLGYRLTPLEADVARSAAAILGLLRANDLNGTRFFRRDWIILSLAHENRAGVFEALEAMSADGRLRLDASGEVPLFCWANPFSDSFAAVDCPLYLSNDQDEEWVRAATAEEAVSFFRDLWGQDDMPEEGWIHLHEELEPEWLKAEPVPQGHARFDDYASEQESDEPVWWVGAGEGEGEEGATLYWCYKGF